MKHMKSRRKTRLELKWDRNIEAITMYKNIEACRDEISSLRAEVNSLRTELMAFRTVFSKEFTLVKSNPKLK